MSTGIERVQAEEQRSCCPLCLGIFRTPFDRCPRDGTVLEELDGDPIVGSTFADRYVIEECIGEGAMGRVYRARHARVSRQFAIKVLFGELAADKTMRARFATEAEAASRLDHPNVISVVDFGETKAGLLYLAMDFVEGVGLGTLIEQQGPFSNRRAASLTRRMCRGLQHAHELGLVHRDFKPDNVIVVNKSLEEIPKIVDFGLAVLPEMSQKDDKRLTADGMVVGSPPYMSPEQLKGEKLGPAADLFALGVTIYEMLTGMTPFDGSPLEMARQNTTDEPPPFAKRRPGLDVSPTFEALVMSLLAKQAKDRPSSALEVIEVLDLAMPPRRIRTNPTSAPPPVHPNVGEPIKQRRPRGLLIGLVFGALVAAAAGFLLLRGGDGEKSAQVANAIDNEVPANSPAKSDTTSAPADRPAAADADGPDAPKTGVPTRDSVDTASLADMSKLHGEVSAALERVKPNKRGRKAAKKLRSRFAAIKYQNAVKDAELRADVIAQLHALQKDVSRTLAKQRRRRDRSKKRKLEKGAVIDAFAN